MTVACQLVLCLTPLLGSMDPDTAVSSGRKALRPWGGYPWYDSSTDGVRPIDLSEPWWARLPALNGNLGLGADWLRPAAWAVLIVLLSILAYLMMRWYRKRLAAMAGSGAESRGLEDAQAAGRRGEALPVPAARYQGDFLDEARRLYAAGRYAEGILYLFGYQLIQLDKHRRVFLAKGKTNRQYLREIGQAGPLQRLVETTMVAFEDVFFGHRTIDRARFESCWLRLPEFEALVREGAV
jgi:hypothetical protein